MDEKALTEQFDNLYKYLDKKFSNIEKEFMNITERFDRLEAHANEDIVKVLKRVERQTKNLAGDVEYLSEKVGKHSLEIDRITRQ